MEGGRRERSWDGQGIFHAAVMAHRLVPFAFAASCTACVAERGTLSNRMAQSGTVYLMRAARQPVSWQPWGREAFAIVARSYRDQRPTIRRQAALLRQLAVTKSSATHGVVRAELVAGQIDAVERSVAAAADNALWTFPYAQAVGLLLGEYERYGG